MGKRHFMSGGGTARPCLVPSTHVQLRKLQAFPAFMHCVNVCVCVHVSACVSCLCVVCVCARVCVHVQCLLTTQKHLCRTRMAVRPPPLSASPHACFIPRVLQLLRQ